MLRLLCVADMFGIASDLAVPQRTQELAASATACYKKADQHVSQVVHLVFICSIRWGVCSMWAG